MSDRAIVSDVEDATAMDRETWVKPVARTQNLTAAEVGGGTTFDGSSSVS
ncbi:hypothetical protein PJ900_01335 (plasmid) [Tistrella mobilis]|nr:hypothetical protein [Tistrella mobilis]